jgi:hypothetical protein
MQYKDWPEYPSRRWADYLNTEDLRNFKEQGKVHKRHGWSKIKDN